LKVSFSSHILRISLFTFERSRPLYSGNRFPIESAINKIVIIKILAKIVKSIIIIDERERGRMGEWRCIEEHHLPVFKVIQLKGTELVPLLGGPRAAGGGVLKSSNSP
jgi:hypothetical protein